MPKKQKSRALTKKSASLLDANSLVQLEVGDGGRSTDLYTKIPCTIGYTYIRFQVDGTVKSCCIAKHEIGSVQDQKWFDVWHSLAYASFRQKLARIHKERFHLIDPEWAFCQQCSHVKNNIRQASALAGNEIHYEY